MSNDNYVPAITGFGLIDDESPGYYIASSIADFNSRNAVDGSFAAFCTFYVRGEVASMPDAEPSIAGGFLWGNQSGNTGWSLARSVSASVLFLVATIGTGAGTVTVDVPLTGTDDGAGNATSLVERLIMAGVWYDGDNLALTINGNIVAPSLPAATYGASAFAPRLGLNPGGTNASEVADILSCGFYNGAPLSATTRIIGQFAGQSFRSAREAFGSGLLLPDAGVDWTHRYSARSLAAGNVPAASSITRNSVGVAITAPAPANQPLPDLGLSGPVDVAGTPVPLNFVDGPAPSGLFLLGQKNPDWYQGAGVVTIAPEG